MRSLPLVLALVGLLLLAVASVGQAPPLEAAPTGFQIDPVHSSILFRVGHLGVSAVYGRFTEFEGRFTLDAENPAGSSVQVVVQAGSVDTGHEGRDRHLAGPDFFNAAEHATIRFESTKVAKTTSANHVDVTGKLTLHGVTKEVTVRMQKLGERDLGERMGYRAGFEGTLTVRRSAFGMGWGVDKGMLGDDVKLILAFEGVRK